LRETNPRKMHDKYLLLRRAHDLSEKERLIVGLIVKVRGISFFFTLVQTNATS